MSSSAAAQNTPPFETHTVDPNDLLVADFGRTTENGEVQSILQIRTAQTMFESASNPGRGTIRFIDPDRFPTENREMEFGFYQWGVGVFTQNLFEFWTSGVSIRSLRGDPSFLAVRDLFDTKDIRLSHDGVRGLISTTGFDPGGIGIEGNGPVSVQAFSGDVSLTAESAVNMNAGGGVTIDGGGAVAMLGDGAVDVESRAAALSLRGGSRVTIDGNGPVSMEGNSSVTVEARTGNVSLIGATGVSVAGGTGAVTVQGKNLTATAPTGTATLQGNSAMVTGTSATVRGTNSTVVQSTAGPVTLDAATDVAVVGTGAVSITGGAAVSVNGATVNMTGTGAVSVQAGAGNLSLAATTGEVRMSAGIGSPVRVDSTGSVYVPGDIYVKGVKVNPNPTTSSPVPTFATVTPVQSQFGAIGGFGASWTVDPTDVYTYGYSKSGNIMTVWFLFARTTVVGDPLVLTIATPEGVRGLVQAETTCYVSDDNAEYSNMPCLVAGGEKLIRIYRPSYYRPWPTSTNKTSVRGTITFPFAP